MAMSGAMSDRNSSASAPRRADAATSRPDRQSTFYQAALATTLILGGAGGEFALVNAAVQLIGLSVLWVVAWNHPGRVDVRGRSPMTWLLILSIVLVALQLVPLPPALWTSLPGRELAARISDAVGLGQVWRPLSLDPHATITTAAELVAGIAFYAVGRISDDADRTRLYRVIVAAALVSLAIGAIQRATHGSGLAMFATYHAGDSPGLFSNRNHQAAFMLLAMPLVAMLARQMIARGTDRMTALGGAGLLIVVLLAGCLATTSRAGMLVSPIALVGSIALLTHGERLRWIAIALIGVVAAAALLLTFNATARVPIDRMLGFQDVREDYWRTTLAMARDYLPFGSGLGTFTTVYPLGEPLAEVIRANVNAAHNDFVQLLLEGGVPAVVLMIGYLVLVGRAAIKAWVANARENRQAAAVSMTLLILLLCSLTDYPLRNPSLLAIFGLFSAAIAGRGRISRARRRPVLIVPAAVATTAACVAIAAPAAAFHAMLAGQPDAALQRDPYWPDALSFGGVRALYHRDAPEAQTLATRALRVSPLDASALADLVLVNESLGPTPFSRDRLLELAAWLGWREPRLQMMLVGFMDTRDRFQDAVNRADALMRTDSNVPEAQAYLRGMTFSQVSRDALAVALRRQPIWRGSYLKNLKDLTVDRGDDHLALLRLLQRQGNLARDEAAPFIGWVDIQHGPIAAAKAAQVLGGAALWDDPRLTRLFDGKAKSPFDWSKGDAIGASIQPSASENAGGVSIALEEVAAGTVLRRRLALPAGSYDVSTTSADTARSALPGRWRMTCQGPGKVVEATLIASATPARGTMPRVQRFSVPNEGCSGQSLSFVVDTSSSELRRFQLESVTINSRP